MTAARWRTADRILCVRLDNMGDVLMTTPAFRALKEARPGRRLTLLASGAGAAVARHVPEIDDVIVYRAPWIKATPASPISADDFAAMERLRGRFDAAIVFTVFSQNPLPAALFCHLAGIPLRLAYCRENPYHLLTDWRPEVDRLPNPRHEVKRQLDLVETVGCRTGNARLSFNITDAARRRARELLSRLGLDPHEPYVAIHPGATAPSRRYPSERFSEVATRINAETGLPIVFTGDAGDLPLVARTKANAAARSVAAAGRFSLAELAAVIEGAAVLITNNSGPVHLAAAAGTPVVDLYALTNPQHTPWNVPSEVLYQDVPCRNCFKSVCPMDHHACLRGVEPSRVVAATLRLLRIRVTRPAAAV